ncbi:MAG: O-antigen ligase family protein [Pseudomonadota bacterium]
MQQLEKLPTNPGRTALAVFAVACLAPAVALGGNRFLFAAPSVVAILGLIFVYWREIAAPWWGLLWVAPLIWGALQIALGLTMDADAGWRSLTQMCAYGAAFLIAAAITVQIGLRAMTALISLWVAALSIAALAAWSTGVNPVLGELEAYWSALEGSFINRNAFASYLVLGVLAAVTVMMIDIRRRSAIPHKILWLLVISPILCTLMLTGSRGGAAACLIGLSAFAMRSLGGKGGLVTLALLTAGFVMTAFAPGYLRPLAPLDDPRIEVHATLWTLAMERPFAGYGLGAFQDAARPHLAQTWRWGDWDHAHQQYLETIIEIGWPAALSLFAAIGFAAWNGVKGRSRAASALAIGATSAMALQALVDFTLTIPAVALSFALILGAAAGEQRRLAR